MDEMETLPPRLRAKVQIQPNGCWVWTGSLHEDGYGLARIDGKTQRAHRAIYKMLRGPIPGELPLDHIKELCSTRACCNPDHLEPVTQAENIQRGQTGKHLSERTHCNHGHEFTSENTGRRSDGTRCCLICRRAADRRRYHSSKAAG